MKKRAGDSHGSFYLKVTSKEHGKWILMLQSYEDGKRKQQTVDEFVYQELGLKRDLPIEEAKKRIRLLNRERSIERKKIVAAGRRVVELQSFNKTYFNAEDVTAFQEVLVKENRLHDSSEEHLQKLFSHFNFVQQMVADKLKCHPKDYKENSALVYEYLKARKVSVNYSQRLISMLNKWGTFFSKGYGLFYEPVSKPRGKVRSSISSAQKTKSGVNSELGVRTESLPLSFEHLHKHRNLFLPEHHAWIFISLALGLRPSEVDLLKSEKYRRLGIDRKSRVSFLEVYQTKLTSIDEALRWKKIPLILEEQFEAIKLMREGRFKRPHPKTMRKHLKGNYTLYAGRKGFTDLMLEQGQTLENISVWLGHKSIETTWKHYKEKETIRYTETDEILKLLKGQ